MHIIRLVCLCLLSQLLWLASCSPVDSTKTSTDKDEGDAVRIVCTTGMIADLVRAIVGEDTSVIALFGAGVDPHLYKPTRADVVRLSSANLVFYNGLHLEGKMSELLGSLKSQDREVVAVAEVVLKQQPGLLTEDAEDPHLWMDVKGWISALSVIEETLCAYKPEKYQKYRANASSYRDRLKELDAYVAASLATIPEMQRILLTAHDAFGYLGKAYGIEVRGIQGMSTESEAGLHGIEELVDCIVERSVPAIFVETSVSDKNVRAIVEGATARGCPVSIGGELFSDAMGVPGSYMGTYIGMMDHNATTIANALGGHANGFIKR